ncbi:uncharacterized protein LOC127726619 [Mytilus californianus]|uniref:uncharacterized protein LOC127726619 n=1 Tax=Mytilus californianus TaxID=6549 RepID=UPI002245C794|nr:uncharacterized protein LOC127726619 [Mytilus californianus]
MERVLQIIINIFIFLKKQGIGQKHSPVNTVLQVWIGIVYKKEIRCSFCDDEGIAVGYCTDCARLIDQQCVKFHDKIVDLQDHKIINFSRDSRMFRVKEFAPKKFCLHSRQIRLECTDYCTNCCVLVCKKCLKHHTTKNHYVNSVYHLYDLLDHIHDTKRLIEDILRSSANLNPKDRLILTTIITYTDISLGITNDYKNIGDAPVPPEIQDLVEREMTPGHVTYLKCEAVIDKVKEIQRDLRLPFMDSRPDSSITDDTSDIIDSTDPKQIIGDTTDEHLHDDLSSQCSSSTDSSYVTCEDIDESIPSTGFGPITVASHSCTTDDLFPSLQRPENENNSARTIEQEIVHLQQAPQNQINLDSFNNLHQ